MANKKEEIKSEVKKNIRSIAILIIVLALICYNFSLAKLFNFTENQRIIWAFDVGIYNILVSMLFSFIYYFYRGRKLQINIDILNKKEDTDGITLRGENPEEIYVQLNIEGRHKKFSSKMEISFPHWLDVQIKQNSYSYLSFDEDQNICLIDLEKLLLNKENVSLTESITFDIIKNSDEKNEDLVEAKLELGLFTKLFLVGLENKGIKIKTK